jgi:hypothetical protein
MQFFGRLKRSKQGVGSIIGAVFVILILLSGLTFYATYLSITDDYYETLGSMGDLGWSQNQERIVIKQVTLTAANSLNLTVENDGAVQSRLIWIGVFNKSAVPEDQTYYRLDKHLNPSERLNIVTDFTVVQGLKYAIQLVTELGNIVQNVFYPASEVRCALSLTAASPTTYEGNNVTVMLTVTHNDTEVDGIQSLTAGISVAPSGLVQLVDNSPLTVTGLARGESAFFWWVYNTNGMGTVTFNATYLQAPAGTYALTNVNVLTSPGQGGGGSVSISGVNGTAKYNPLNWTLLGATQYVSGLVADLAINDSNYVNFNARPLSYGSDQWLSGWSERVNITLDHNDITVSLSYFPVLIYLSSSSGRYGDDVSFVFDELQSDANRKKIAVTTSDGITQCYVEIEKWDTANKKAWLSVKVPSISSTADTVLYLYYDSSHADNTVYVGDPGSTPSQNVWDGNFKGVWHMEENPAGTPPQMKDSTLNGNNGTSAGSMTGSDQVTAMIDGGLDFDGSNDEITCGNAVSLRITTEITIEAWAKTSVSGATMGIVNKEIGTYAGYQLRKHSDNHYRFATGNPAAPGQFVTSDSAYTDSGWHHIVGVRRSGTNYLYIDGVQQTATSAGAITDSGANFDIGRAYSNYYDDYWWNGIIDEVRVSNTSRSAAWIKASYESERDDLVAYGKEIYRAKVEFTGSSDLQNWTSLVWQIDSAWSKDSVNVTIRFYDYTLPGYVSSGPGYINYNSSSTQNSDELKSQTINLNPISFRNSTGYWNVTIEGVKLVSMKFQMKINWIELQDIYESTGKSIPYNAWQWYTIRATSASGDPIPYAYVSIYANGTLVYFRNATDKVDIGNPAWVRLDAGGQFMLEVRSANGSGETFVLYAVVGSTVGQETVTQEAS